LGVDVDENACTASRLSLALLHLVLTDSLPKKLNIVTAESLDYFDHHRALRGTRDVVVANPPFVPITLQNQAMRDRVAKFMGEHASGRIDTYLAFLKLGLEMLRPGGYGLYVLPHSFLLGKNAAKMRELLFQGSWIRCLADLSAIRVFEDSDSYVVLLIFQKKPGSDQKSPPATVVKCQDLVGLALEDVVNGRASETSFYSVYEVEQGVFGGGEWLVLPPTESEVQNRVRSLPRLAEFLEVREGFISGADPVFVIAQERIPKGEEAVYAPYLPDREMQVYTVPARTSRCVFYPFIDGRKLDESVLRDKFVKTWRYLQASRTALQGRLPVKKGHLRWWEPTRPRSPGRMLRPKIVTPHLVLVPRFSLDSQGKYAVSRSPLLYPRDSASEGDLLRFFLAVLNSTVCYWHIAKHSHKYQRGYVMLEPKTLENTPVPDPTKVSLQDMRRLLDLVNKRLGSSSANAWEIQKEIDTRVADLYALSRKERRALGMEAQ